MRSLKKLLTLVSRVTKQKERPTLTHGDTLLYIERSFLFYTLVQFGISLVLSQVVPTPPNGKKKEKSHSHYSCCRDFKSRETKMLINITASCKLLNLYVSD